MAILNMTAASEALKLFYLPGLRNQLNNSNPILSVIDRDQESVLGSEIVMALRYGRQGGIGNRADDGILPTPNSRKTKQAKWETKNIFARIQISDKTMRASRGSGGFVSLLEADLEDAKTDAMDNMARQVYGDGTGKMATFTAEAAAGNTHNVDNVIYFAEGQFIDIIDTTNGSAKATLVEVTAVDDINNTITLGGAAVQTAATDIAVISGNYNQELTGLGSVFTNNNTLYNIDRNANKWFNAITDTGVGTISETRIQKNIDDADRKAGGKVNFLNSSYGVRRAYQDLLTATKRTTDVMNLQGGWKALAYNDMPFATDKYCPTGTLFGLDLTTIKLYHVMDWDWLDQDGAVLHRVADKPVWEATMARYCDLGCSKPKGNFRMSGITES